nr:Peptidase M10A M12B domain containing protein [Haemonchus contortus]
MMLGLRGLDYVILREITKQIVFTTSHEHHASPEFPTSLTNSHRVVPSDIALEIFPNSHQLLSRRKRYVVRKKRWNRNLLTWRLDLRNVKEEDEYVIRATLHRAFHEWSSVSNVRFEEVKKPPANIVIGFERGRHQDAFPFDGKDGVVAHAFYPRDGRLHFDADEDWTLNSDQGVNLFQTAVHEIGHLLGLEHSVDPRAVMFSAKRPYDPDFTLGDDDVRAIRVLFPFSDDMEDSQAFEKPVKYGDADQEMTISQVVENLLGGPPPVTAKPFVITSDELTFPFPLPRTNGLSKSTLVQ